jgi:hypothetical protein
MATPIDQKNLVMHVYVPSALLIIGSAFIDYRLVPVAVAMATGLAFWTIAGSSESSGLDCHLQI